MKQTECIFVFDTDFVSIGDVRIMVRTLMRRRPDLRDLPVSVTIKCPGERPHGVTFLPSMWKEEK